MLKPIKIVASTAKPKEPKADTTVNLKDGERIPLPSEIEAGKHTILVTNSGTLPHLLAILKVLPGKTAEDVEAFFKAGKPEPFPFEPVGGMHGLAPGKKGWNIIDLKPGTYVAFDDFPGPKPGLPTRFTVK